MRDLLKTDAYTIKYVPSAKNTEDIFTMELSKSCGAKSARVSIHITTDEDGIIVSREAVGLFDIAHQNLRRRRVHK